MASDRWRPEISEQPLPAANPAILPRADLRDLDDGVLMMDTPFGIYPSLLKLYADAGDQGPKFQDGFQAVCRSVNIEIVQRRDLHKFVVLPRR